MKTYNQIVEDYRVAKTFNVCSKVFKMVIMVLVVSTFGYLSVQSVLNTTLLEDTLPSRETISYHHDNVWLNAVIMAVAILGLSFLIKNVLHKLDTKKFSLVLCVYTLIVGLVWILSVKSAVDYDSEEITSTAIHFTQGDYSDLTVEDGYFSNYPYQLGYVLVCQLVNVLFKDDSYYVALQVLNLLALIGIFLAFIYVSHVVFKDRAIVNTTVLLLFGCTSGIMFTTFVYGNFVSYALAMWAVAMEVKYIRTDRRCLMVVSSVLIGLSIVVKPNSMIVLVAMCVILFIKFLDTKQLWDLVSIMLCVVFGLNFINIVLGVYEVKANVYLGGGIPKILWLNMGLHESNLGYGWFNSTYTMGVFYDSNKDPQLATQMGLEQIKEQISYFLEDSDYTVKFFTEKVLSQWNEPTYASIWVSETREHTGDVPVFVEDIYYNASLRRVVVGYMNQYQQIVMLMAVVCFARVYSKKDVSMYILPLIVLGGFVYHMLFEAKSQYVLIYFLTLIPMCAYGLNVVYRIDFKSKVKMLLNFGASKE